MTASDTLPLTDRLALALDGLCRAVAARIAGGALAAAMIVLIWRRVKRTLVRIQDLLVRFQAGRLQVRVRQPGSGAGGGRVVAGSRLPLGFGWLLPLVPHEAAGFASQMRVLLVEPEMVALLTDSKEARRALAPLCRMLGIEAGLLRHPPKGGAAESAAVAVPAVAAPVKAKRVRKPRPKLNLGRIPLPRGVLTWARREGFGKPPRE